jgi:hypothetical protein
MIGISSCDSSLRVGHESAPRPLLGIMVLTRSPSPTQLGSPSPPPGESDVTVTGTDQAQAECGMDTSSGNRHGQ